MRPTGCHRTAVIGEPPEHREWNVGDPMHDPEIDETARINALCTIDSGLRQPTRIGPRTFVMARCHVGHDAQIGADCELAPGTVIGGHAVLEDGVRCGIGVLVRPFIRVGAGARLGAGAVVVKDVPAGEVWVGNPARKLEKQAPHTFIDGLSWCAGCHRATTRGWDHAPDCPYIELTPSEREGWETLAAAANRA